MSILKQHPGTSIDDLPILEPLNTKERTENITAAVEWTREYFRKARDEGRFVGFKLSGFPVMRAKEEFAQIVEEFETAVIWNFRLDFFKRSVGRYPFQWLGDDTAVSGISKKELEERCNMGVGCNFDVDNIEDLHCQMTRSWRVHWGMEETVDFLTARSVFGKSCALHVDYHDFLKHPDHVSMQMQDFLGLPRKAIEATRMKATSDNMCEVVSNYADLCAAFSECSEWKDMLNDTENGCSCDNYKFESLGGDEKNKLCAKDADPNGRRWCGTW